MDLNYFHLVNCFLVLTTLYGDSSELKVVDNVLKLSLNVLYQALFKKKSIKTIGHHSHLRDVMGQSYSIHVCTRANEMHYSSVHVHFVVAGFTDLEKNLTVEHMEHYTKFVENHTI